MLARRRKLDQPQIRSSAMRSRWYQLRLRTVLLAVLAISLPLAWLANARRAMRIEEATISGLKTQYVEWQQPPSRWERWPTFHWSMLVCPTEWEDHVVVRTGYPSLVTGLGETLNMRVFQRIEFVQLDGPALDDSSLVALERLPHLKGLQLGRGKFTFAGIDQFRAARPDVQVNVGFALAEQAE
jgi:hypothetical protein